MTNTKKLETEGRVIWITGLLELIISNRESVSIAY